MMVAMAPRAAPKDPPKGAPEKAETPRAKRRREKLAEIHETALRLVGEGGLPALTVVRLARELGLALGGLYRYYPSLSALVVALQRGALADLAKQFEAAGRAVDEPLTRVVSMLNVFVRMPETSPAPYRLIDELISAPEVVLADADALGLEADVGRVLSFVHGGLEACAASGVLSPGDAELRTVQLWTVLHGVSHMRKRDRLVPPKLRVAALRRATLRDLFASWGATDAHIARALDVMGPAPTRT